jgi:hypothetical protein
MGHAPATLRVAAAVQAAESVVVLTATVFAGIDTAAGRSYQLGSGIALTVIGAASAAALALVAAGLARARRWSRTPALLTQLFAGIVGIYLLQGQRLEWGVPLIVLAAAGLAALLAPPSLRALVGPGQGQAGQGQASQGRAGQGRARREPGSPRPPGSPGQPGSRARRGRARPDRRR